MQNNDAQIQEPFAIAVGDYVPENFRDELVAACSCRVCGSTALIRTGTCHVCANCGSSQGCS
jgi:hypothetical protein